MLRGFLTVMAAVPLVGVLLKWLFSPYAWPPDGALLLMWLAGCFGMFWFLIMPVVDTFSRIRRGDVAGLSIAEGDEHLEVAFFAGGRPWRVHCFVYADIVGCGVDRFAVDASGRYQMRPYVAVRGVMRSSVKKPLPLAISQDLRQLWPGASAEIAADLDRVIRRHCTLPPPSP
jgi:hypothetical protein